MPPPLGTCPVCGRALPPSLGRPYTYCPARDGREKSPCARLAVLTQALAHEVHTLVDQLKEDAQDPPTVALLRTRAFLWKEANAATNWGRLQGAPGRRPYKKKRSGWWRAQGRDTREAPMEAPCPTNSPPNPN